MAFGADGRPRVLRGISVIGINPEILIEGIGPGHQVIKLIVGQSLGRIEVKGTRIRVNRDTLKDRQVVTERFARSRRGNNSDVLPGFSQPESFGLVRIELLDSTLGEHGPQGRSQPHRQIDKAGFSGRNKVIAGNRRVPFQFCEKLRNSRRGSARGVRQDELRLRSHATQNAGQNGQVRSGKGSMERKAFEALVHDALQELPQVFRDKLKNIAIIVEDYPSEELLERMEVPEDETLFGFFEGVPLTERGYFDAPLLPARVLIFQGPIEDACNSPEEIKEEVRITVMHELAHFFGFDDDELDEAGYG